MKKDNRIVVDLGKVQYARFYYRNQWGQTRDTLPDSKHFTINNILYERDEAALWLHGHAPETIFARAARRHVVDVWTPELRLQLQANHSLVYTGSKARSLWKEWNRRQFKK